MIDLPKDVQIAQAATTPAPKKSQHKSYKPAGQAATRAQVEQAIELIADAKRPIFYTGGGVINSGPKASQAAARVRRA